MGKAAELKSASDIIYEGTYLTTTKNGVVRINHFYPSHKRFGYQFTIAWMSMPEPYREGD